MKQILFALFIIIPTLCLADKSNRPASGTGTLVQGVRNTAGATFCDAENDACNLATDSYGRQFINLYGSPADMWSTCSSADVTTATTQTLKSGVASTFFNVTGFTCTNTGGAATRVELRDTTGSTVLYAGMLAATAGYFHADLINPARTTAANHTLEINVVTTGSATRCCISGFNSAN